MQDTRVAARVVSSPSMQHNGARAAPSMQHCGRKRQWSTAVILSRSVAARAHIRHSHQRHGLQ